MRLLLTLGTLVLVATNAIGPLRQDARAQQPQARATRPAIPWVARPAVGVTPPTLAHETCAGDCGNHDLADILITCGTGDEPNLTVQMPDPMSAVRVVGRAATVTFGIGSTRIAVPGKVEDAMDGPVFLGRVAPTAPLFAALANGSTLRLTTPGGSATLPLRGSGEAVAAWQRACGVTGTAPVEPVPTPAVGAAASTVSPSSSERSMRHLARHIGRYDQELVLRDPAVAAAITALTSPSVLRKVRSNMAVRGAIEESGPILVMNGLAPRMGGEEEAMVTVHLDTGEVEVGLMTAAQVTVYGRAARDALSEPMRRWAETRSAPARFTYRQAISRASTGSGAAGSPGGEAVAASSVGTQGTAGGQSEAPAAAATPAALLLPFEAIAVFRDAAAYKEFMRLLANGDYMRDGRVADPLLSCQGLRGDRFVILQRGPDLSEIRIIDGEREGCRGLVVNPGLDQRYVR